MAILVDQFRGSVAAIVDAAPADVFARITDIARLPEWNARIRRVVQAPPVPMVPGAEWVVEMRVPPRSWRSRARLIRLDEQNLVFEHTSRTDDGNPSAMVWSWQVGPAPSGRARLQVSWSGNPRSFWRRLVLARVRRPMLAAEVRNSLVELARQLVPPAAGR